MREFMYHVMAIQRQQKRSWNMADVGSLHIGALIHATNVLFAPFRLLFITHIVGLGYLCDHYRLNHVPNIASIPMATTISHVLASVLRISELWTRTPAGGNLVINAGPCSSSPKVEQRDSVLPTAILLSRSAGFQLLSTFWSLILILFSPFLSTRTSLATAIPLFTQESTVAAIRSVS